MIDRFDSGLTIAEALAEPAGAKSGAPVAEHPIDERVRRAVLDLIAGDRDAPGVERHAGAEAQQG